MTAKDHKTTDTTSSLKQKLNNPDAPLSDELLLEHPSYKELQKRLEEAEEKANQSWERLLRMQAETDNLHRRVERDIANAHKYALEKFVNELLPVIDSFERALTVPINEASSVLEGIQMTLNMLNTALAKFGIQQINPISEPFNPEWHQAVSTQADPNVEPGIVLNVLQKGYLLNNRLIRPALVIVSKNH